MGGSSAPPAPNPVATAQAQTAASIGTAIANNTMSMIPQTNAYGDTTNYSVTGETPETIEGQTYDIPTYSETTTLSPEQQALYSGLQSLEGTDVNTANTLATNAQQELSTPLNLSSYFDNATPPTPQSINSYAQGAWEAPFNQSWNLQQEGLTQQLANEGIAPGDAAYNNAEFNFTQNEQEAMDQYATSMYGTAETANQNAYTDQLSADAQNAGLAAEQYNQPLNELASLQAGTQIQAPSFQGVSSAQVPTTDVAGITQQDYQDQLQAYQIQQSNNSAMYGGLFGLGGSAIEAGGLIGGSPAGSAALLGMFSDRRLKRDVRRVGTTLGGVPIYSYRYLWSEVPQIGVMADEVEHIPGAVMFGADGFARVDYSRVN